MPRLRWVALLSIAVALIATARGALAEQPSTEGRSAEYEVSSFELFHEAWDLVRQDFLYESALDSRRLALEAVLGAVSGGPTWDTRGAAHAAIRRLVRSLDDPNSSFQTPDERKVERAGYTGRLEGIGACVEPRGGRAEVSAVVFGGPAARLGLRPGDLVSEVDGRPTAGVPMQDLVLSVRGPTGSIVALTVDRPSAGPIQLSVTREEIRLVSATATLLQADIGLLRVIAFTETTDEEVASALEVLATLGIGALVLDLRGNLGGLLEPAIAVASRFARVDPIAWKENRRGERTPYPRRSDLRAIEWPLVVLVDGRTASAAEVLAAAIRDAGRGPLVGQRTYGKATIQHIYDLRDGSGLHLTAARWLSPAGSPLDRGGMTPDHAAATATSDGSDSALDLGVQLLRQSLSGPPRPVGASQPPRHECGPNSPNAL